MASLTFDTLRYANRLKDAGVPSAQAEAEAMALSEVLDLNLRELATKEDLKALESRLDSHLDTLELRLTIKLGVFLAGAAGIFGAIVKLL